MELQTFYENIGADYQVVLQRLRRESLIDKYLHLLLKDPVFETLQHAELLIPSKEWRLTWNCPLLRPHPLL